MPARTTFPGQAMSKPQARALMSAAEQTIELLSQRIGLLEAVVNNFPGGLLLFDHDLTLVLCNDRQRQLLEYPDELFAHGNPTLEQIFRFNAERGEYGPGRTEDHVKMRMELVARREPHVFERTRPNGTILEIRGMPLSDGGFVTTYVDVSEQRRAQALIQHLAHHDQLTGLANRALLMDRLHMALAQVKRGRRMALHYIDLDKFKPINDRHGHAAGDQVLKRAAAAMQRSVRETDTVARIGGDEFVIIQTDIETTADAGKVARRVLDAVSEPHFAEGADLSVGASIGIAQAPWDGDATDELLRKADLALYRSKEAGGSRINFYSSPPKVEATTAPEQIAWARDIY
jgi:diguanylate cyclase (GGDEF)-like protein